MSRPFIIIRITRQAYSKIKFPWQVGKSFMSMSTCCIEFVCLLTCLFFHSRTHKVYEKNRMKAFEFVTPICNRVAWRLNKTKQRPFWYCNQNTQLIRTHTHQTPNTCDVIDQPVRAELCNFIWIKLSAHAKERRA